LSQIVSQTCRLRAKEWAKVFSIGPRRGRNGFDQPLVVLAAFCRQVLDSDYLLKELVREADVEWGRIQGERPYFGQEGSAPNPDDPYTFESVRKILAEIIQQLAASE
jgi:hypothetical protein